MKEKKYRFYSILEDTYLNHLIRIDTDRSLAKNLTLVIVVRLFFWAVQLRKDFK